MQINQKVRKFIESHLIEQEENVTLNDEDMIFELGFLDSMFALQLVNFIEKEFSIKVTDEDLDIFNFSSVKRIVAFVNGKIKNKHDKQ